MASKRYLSGKTYTHSTGHSCAFRQWRADSHCNLIHGYALQFELQFGSIALDDKNWVVDFGGLKELKEWLKHMFDHTYLVAEDDPEMDDIKILCLSNQYLENKGYLNFIPILMDRVRRHPNLGQDKIIVSF